MSTCLLFNRGSIILRGKPKNPAVTPLGRWIDDHMARRGFTVRGLAEAAGVSGPRITQIRQGDSTTRDMIERLARAMSPHDADERTSATILREGLKAGGFLDTGEITYEIDPDIQMIVEAYSGGTITGKRAIKSAAELAMEMSREGSIGGRRAE